jgi:serine phosphatase RsbU (regulator of sigma subunit)/tetratricopeptide (TPR) repeat protein
MSVCKPHGLLNDVFWIVRVVLSGILVLLLSVLTGQDSQSIFDSLNKAARSPDADTRIDALTDLAKRYHISGKLRDSQLMLERAAKEVAESKSEKGLSMLLNTKGVLFYYRNMFDSAIWCFEKSVEIRRRTGDKAGLAKSIANIGAIHYMKLEYKKALTYFEEAMDMETELKMPEGSLVSLNNIAQVYHMLKLNSKALQFFKRAERVYSASGGSGDLSFTYDGLSNVYQDYNKLDSALYYSIKSKEAAESQNDLTGAAYALVNLGSLYAHAKRTNDALTAYQDALRRALLLKDKRLQLGVYGNLAALYLEKNDLDAALVYLEKLIPLQEELNYRSNEAELEQLFAEYYYRKHDYRKAFDHLRKYKSLNDSIYNLEASRQIAEMQEKYQTEKKEKLNQALQLENEKQKTVTNYLLAILGLSFLTIAGAVIAYRKIRHAKSVISAQKELVDEKQKEILDSIRYAKRIQFALLASDKLLRTHLPEHFVLFRPKDVVSGDFYWGIPSPEGFIYVTGDCTGHGVPGAFMSLLNISKLSEVIVEQHVRRPDLILNQVRSEIIRALNPDGTAEESRDGMDAVICKLDVHRRRLEYASANNPFFIARNKSLITCKADKMPVGHGHDDETPFTHNEIALEPGDVIYTFTDGYADQFGGRTGKKFKYKQFEELLLSICHEEMHVQRAKLSETFDLWRGPLEQVDDVCVIGIRIP